MSESDKVITRIDRTGAVLATIPFGDEPSAIAVGAGAVWVADRWDDRVARIDPVKNDVEIQIPVGEHPTGVAVGEGRVWVANSRAGTSPTGVAVANGLAWVTVSPAAFAARSTTVGAASGVGHIDLSSLDFDSVDPAVGYNWQVTQATCVKLVNYPDVPPPAGSRLIPEAARTLPKRTDGGKTYTFTIRPGFRFSPPSNAPVTAATFKYSIERTLSPKSGSPAAGTGYVNEIVGAKAYEHGKVTEIGGIVARGNTLTIRLEHPLPDLPAKLAIPWFCAVPIGTPADPNGLPIPVLAAGPYYIASHTPGERLVLKRNPNYHGAPATPPGRDRHRTRHRIESQHARRGVGTGRLQLRCRR